MENVSRTALLAKQVSEALSGPKGLLDKIAAKDDSVVKDSIKDTGAQVSSVSNDDGLYRNYVATALGSMQGQNVFSGLV